jgi:hypothetical protein
MSAGENNYNTADTNDDDINDSSEGNTMKEF